MLNAFTGLLGLLPVERQEQVLRRALGFVVAIEGDSSSTRPLSERSPPLSASDVAAWGELRQRVRHVLELNRKSFGDLAAETGIARSSLEKVLSPSGSAAGKLVAGRLEEWLAQGPTPKGNGAAPGDPTARLITGRSLSPSNPVRHTQRPPEGLAVDASEERPSPGRLGEREREVLSGAVSQKQLRIEASGQASAAQLASGVASLTAAIANRYGARWHAKAIAGRRQGRMSLRPPAPALAGRGCRRAGSGAMLSPQIEALGRKGAAWRKLISNGGAAH